MAISIVSVCGSISYGIFPIIFSLILVIAVWRKFFHPLARVPGPPLAAISSVWYAWNVRNGHLFQLGRQLHLKYGPAVRVRPNEVWLNDKDAFKIIYSPTRGYEKSTFYLATALLKPKLTGWFRWQSPDTLDLLAERNMKRYRSQRRMIGPVYNIMNLKRHESAIDKVLEKAVSQLQSLEGLEVDLKEWMHIIAVECLSAVSISWSPGYLHAKSDGASGKHAYMGWRRRSVLGLFPFVVQIESVSNTAGRLFSLLWGVTYKTPKSGFRPFFPVCDVRFSNCVYTKLTQAVQKKISQRIKVGMSPLKGTPKRTDIVADLVNLHVARPEFNERYLRRMAITNFGAGHETLTSTLISTIAMIGTHSGIQARLSALIDSRSWPISYEDATNMEFILASIKEAQRLYPVIGMSLPRTVPSDGLIACGHYMPPGTIVGCNPGSLHRNPDIFGANPELYIPQRWLNENGRQLLEKYNLIYGGGPRICPGKALAEMLVTKIVVAVVRQFKLEVIMPPEQEIRYYFMAMLTGAKLRVTSRVIKSVTE